MANINWIKRMKLIKMLVTLSIYLITLKTFTTNFSLCNTIIILDALL